jgi:DNA-3-methyladenine glycosylase I
MSCSWPGANTTMIAYHDTEWGVPLHDDRGLFEYLILDAFQAGLSWQIVLKKRQAFEKAFAGFDPSKVAAFTEKDCTGLMEDAGIIRNRLKIKAAVVNAQLFLAIQKEFGSFDAYIWQFVCGSPIVNEWKTGDQIPAKSPESDAMSNDLKKRGFKFVGSTICYAFMQAAGMVNDHLISCVRHKAVQSEQRAVS